MRIALVTEYYYPDVGGMPEHVFFLGRELQRRGHAVTVITADFGPSPTAMPNAIPVVRVGSSAAFFSNGSISRVAVGLTLPRRVREVLHDGKFDVIHVHSPTIPVLPMLAIKNAPRDATLIGTLHTHFEPALAMRIFSAVLQRYLDALDGIIAVAENAARSIARSNQIRYRVIPNGVDIEYFASGRRLPSLDDGKLNLMFLGRLEPRNDIPRLLTAFQIVRRQMDGVRLVLVGDGPAREYYRHLVAPELRDDVVFAGTRIQERPDYLVSCDVFCFTARIVSSPMALREGMAAGCACIANDIDGCDELVSNEQNGLLVPRDGAQPLAEAMLRLLRDPSERAAIGARARERATEFAWPSIAERVERFYLERRG
jgi:phosphatidylinositol alpha-mannosyltransferase